MSPKTAGSAKAQTRALLPQVHGQRLSTASPSTLEIHDVLDEWMWRARLGRAAPIEGGNKERGVARRSNSQIGVSSIAGRHGVPAERRLARARHLPAPDQREGRRVGTLPVLATVRVSKLSYTENPKTNG